MLRWLIGIIVLVIVAHFVINELLPAMRESGRATVAPTSPSASADDAGRACAEAAAAAYDTVVGEIRALGPPPVDGAAWSSVILDLGAALKRADSACLCFEAACEKGAEAVNELRSLISLYDGMTRMDATGNPATYMERAAALVDEARDRARAGARR